MIQSNLLLQWQRSLDHVVPTRGSTQHRSSQEGFWLWPCPSQPSSTPKLPRRISGGDRTSGTGKQRLSWNNRPPPLQGSTARHVGQTSTGEGLLLPRRLLLPSTRLLEIPPQHALQNYLPRPGRPWTISTMPKSNQLGKAEDERACSR